MTLHTSPNCAVTGGSGGLLQPYSQDCNTAVNGNEGCSFHETNPASYGTTLNQDGGAIYAMEWTSDGISIWWWGGGNPAPADVLGDNPDPTAWGPPSSQWAGDGCVWDQHFLTHQIIFDMTFCGDWAGQVFATDPVCSAKGACTDYVANTPGDFSESYWSVNALKLYQDNGADIATNATKRAAASQAAPQDIPKASQTVDAKAAIKAAQAGIDKRAAASQIAPHLVPKESQTVDAKLAVSRAQADKAKADGNGKRGVDQMAEIRRRKYAHLA